MLTGTDYENMGRVAASEYVSGNKPLNGTITKIAEHYGLNSEQIARVVEQANVETYLKLNKTAEDKYIEFENADTVKIASALNFKMRKEATIDTDYNNIVTDDSFELVTSRNEKEIEVLSKADELFIKRAIKNTMKKVSTKLEDFNETFSREAENLYQNIKQAALETGKYGLVKQAMLAAIPDSTTEMLADAFKTKLQKEGSAIDFDDLETPQGILNKNHPVIKSLTKLAEQKKEYIELNNFKNELEKLAKGNVVELIRGLTHTGKAGVGIVADIARGLFTTFKEIPSLLVGVGALGVGTAIGVAKSRTESSKTNVRINKKYVTRAANRRPL